jgi:hypothetical protein
MIRLVKQQNITPTPPKRNTLRNTACSRGRCSQLKTRTSSYQFEPYVFLNLDSIFS